MTRTYNDISIKTESGQIESNCAGITFLNDGALGSVVTINNAVPLISGRSITLPVNKDEVDITKYTFVFNNSGVRQKLVIISRKYENFNPLTDLIKKKVVNDFSIYSIANYVESDCGYMTFFNSGSTDFIILNAVRLIPFQYLAFNVNEDELDVTKYFFTPVPSAGFSSQLSVIKKKYT